MDGATYAWLLDGKSLSANTSGDVSVYGGSDIDGTYFVGNSRLLDGTRPEDFANTECNPSLSSCAWIPAGDGRDFKFRLAFSALFDDSLAGVITKELECNIVDNGINQCDLLPPPPVPVPAVVWLFSTALIGLLGFSKRRKAA